MSLGFKYEVFMVKSSVIILKKAQFKELRGAAPF